MRIMLLETAPPSNIFHYAKPSKYRTVHMISMNTRELHSDIYIFPVL